MFTFLLVIHALIAAALVTVILMQRSEGGGLGMGGGPAGLMSARGAADFLTRATSVLATLFVVMAFILATVASMRNSGGKIDTSLEHQGAPGPITAPLPAAPLPATGIPMMGAPTVAPTIPAPTATAPVEAPKPTRAAPTAASLKTIDTAKVAPTGGNIGIGGIAGAPHSIPHKVPAPAASTPAPAADKPVPTLNIAPPAPATTAPANGGTPQP